MLKEMATSGITGDVLWYESMQAKFHMHMNNKSLHRHMTDSMFAKILIMGLSGWCNFCLFLAFFFHLNLYYFKSVPKYVPFLQKQ